MSLVTAAASGDSRELLEALRDRLAQEIDDCTSGRDLAALSARLTDVVDRLDGIPAMDGSTAAEDIAKRRRERRESS